MHNFGKVLIGADPELFLMNPNDGGFVSAHLYIPGTKKKPFKVDKGAIQLDGTAAEFNIDPASTVDEFISHITTVLGGLKSYVADTGYVLAAAPVAEYDPVYFDQSVPTKQKILGCDPDFNAWELRPNSPPDQTASFRTAAGHIHVGWGTGFNGMDPDHFELCASVARQLDYHLGINSLVWDGDVRRRSLYGKAGAFRPKPYGVEYRTLSNAWLGSEVLQRWVYTATVKAMEDLDAGRVYEEEFGPLARSIIDTNQSDWVTRDGMPKFDLPDPPMALKEITVF